MDEKEQRKILENYLQEKRYALFPEFQLTSSILQISDLTKRPEGSSKKQIRIDLAALCPQDSSILFFEIEREFFLEHPLEYLPFADYTFLVCPGEALDNCPPNQREETMDWAKDNGLGILLIVEEEIKILVVPRKQLLASDVRIAIRKQMETRNQQTNDFPLYPWWVSGGDDSP